MDSILSKLVENVKSRLSFDPDETVASSLATDGKKKHQKRFNPNAVADQLTTLQLKTVDDDKDIERKTRDILDYWKKHKPVGGKHKLEDVMKLLNNMEKKLQRLQEEREHIQKVKEALELTEAGVNSPTDQKVIDALLDVESVKVNWMTISRVRANLESLKDTPWKSVNPKKLRIQLDTLSQQLHEMPEEYGECKTVIECNNMIAMYQKYMVVITQLKSENLKGHHWKNLIKVLGIKWDPDNMTLQDIWKIDFEKHGQAIMDILSVAQGEGALEEFLKQIKETWSNYELEMVNYQHKCHLIRGWDELFTTVREDISSVNAMKLSPYFKKFEQEAKEWEENLVNINSIFDIWIDVQRKWVYLEGIFAGSSDIKALLPVESKNFNNVSNDFLGLMKKVAKTPNVLQIIKIPRVQAQVQGLSDNLKKIQKSLGEYLERQRAAFARFYFIGDDDLLEIIGNSKNIPRLQKHFKKMFAGLNSLDLTDNNTIITGIQSKEGECMTYAQQINIREYQRLNDWMNMLEKEMRISLAKNLANAIVALQGLQRNNMERQAFIKWADNYQAQLVVLAAQVTWSEQLEAALKQSGGSADPVNKVLTFVETNLNVLADCVLYEQPIVRRRKLEHLIIERVHQRDVIRMFLKKKILTNNDFEWLSQMRFNFDSKLSDPLLQLNIRMANAQFFYGFEYLGLCDRLVQTPLTDRCFLTLTQALEGRLGGSPFGPAGTGKTESVKALGNQLGRFVLVFNCDETFDFLAMGRIFVGLCQVGAWGCFDEFNRLEERMLSAVSQQIQNIQESLRELSISGKGVQVELLGNKVVLHPDIAIFITMNPGYAGRSNLPDNLKKLFRSIAMTQPDRQLIAQVMLYSQGFRLAEKLACKVVPLFKLCDEQLSSQSHYDFGLRALKSVLVSAGNVKRDGIQRIKSKRKEGDKELDANELSKLLPEQEVVIQSLMETLVPKLVSEDIPLLFSLLKDVFPDMAYKPAAMKDLRRELKSVCEELCLTYSDTPNTEGYLWTEKVLQLYQISNIHHGLMMVGPSGSGKSMAWRVLLRALDNLEGMEGVAHVIDPKSVVKDCLYGSLDPNTREWTDGLFTHILRKIIDSVRGEVNKRQWIIFDGDVDPEWVENLNSVLDDNKLLTLPNGERLAIPPNVRIMFEVQNLKYATLATVSRCGMVWFSDDVLTDIMIMRNFLMEIRSIPIKVENLHRDPDEEEEFKEEEEAAPVDDLLMVQSQMADVFGPYFTKGGVVVKTMKHAQDLDHVMDFTRMRALNSFFAMCRQMVSVALTYGRERKSEKTHLKLPNNRPAHMPVDIMKKFVPKSIVIALIWAFSGDCKLSERELLGEYIKENFSDKFQFPSDSSIPVMDFEVSMEGDWNPWTNKIPKIEVDVNQVTGTEVVIPTLDTVRHENIIYTWVAQHKPVLLCGPPGSGKTMTLFSVLRDFPQIEVVGLNFSSATTPELLTKTFDQYCEFQKTANGIILTPQQHDKWIIFFCDEINLPNEDNYGTQRVISFLRQMVEHAGYYRTTDMQWVTFNNIQFVGACNPPTDPGRKLLSHRFLRHVPVIYVDYPGETSLKQIYGTFNRAILRNNKNISPCSERLTNAMVDFFLLSQKHFTHEMQPHYIYSPREMTRWMRGTYEALKARPNCDETALVRIWAHEALRLFQDRLVYEEERQWCDDQIDSTAQSNFPEIDYQKAVQRPILFSKWLSKIYQDVDQEKLRKYLQQKLKKFYEEELGVPLVMFNQVLDHVLRVDRVFRQPQGHLLLIGVSGAGKTTLSRFVAWLNGLSVFQVKVHKNYTAFDFDEDLRQVLVRCGCNDEKICFIMDETNIKDSSFLERINTLLANAEVPGLFEGEEHSKLMTMCKEAASKEGFQFSTGEELYRWFTHKISINLHVVFTMNPSTDGLKDRASTSPALFNRCVLNWLGDWTTEAYFQVSKEFVVEKEHIKENYIMVDSTYTSSFRHLPENITYHDVVSNVFVFIHKTLHGINQYISQRGGRIAAITPRHYLDAIAQYTSMKNEKIVKIEEERAHLANGLKKIKETEKQVEVMQGSLEKNKLDLEGMKKIANEKMTEIAKQKAQGESRKVVGQEMQKKINKQEAFIAEKKIVVQKELDLVAPAVIEAQTAVSSIQKKDLSEIKAMRNPPLMVKVSIESVCVLLGETNMEWRNVQSVMAKENFVQTIINFKTSDISESAHNLMMKNYISNPDYTFDRANRASAACGPLVKWAVAQLSYKNMLLKMGPLQRELDSLTEEADVNKQKAQEVTDAINTIKTQIDKYQKEHAALMVKVNAIKDSLESVENKVNRSVNLLKSLNSERTRWQKGTGKFQKQLDTNIGDCLLSGAYMAYAGYYDPNIRHAMLKQWCDHLKMAKISFAGMKKKESDDNSQDSIGGKGCPNFSVAYFLSSPNDRMRWKNHGLPADDLCLENAIILSRYKRYPLIIDPCGQGTNFLMSEYKKTKLTKTSFLDINFRKTLESAMRFGTPLLVEDVETYDSILNPVLNREIRSISGRTVITIGSNDVDLSPTFTIYLSAKDPTIEFPQDISSRVTFVNFTVTRCILQTQCLNTVLKSERPDMDTKRNDLLKLQGEFQLKLFNLEKNLLDALSQAKGNILEDDTVIGKLETLKKEARDVEVKVKDTDKVLKEVDVVLNNYFPLATACTNIFMTLDNLNFVLFLYNYSPQFMFDIFDSILVVPELKDVTDYDKRLKILTKALFKISYNRISRGMLYDDRIILALQLVRIYIIASKGEPDYKEQFEAFLSGKSDQPSDCKIKAVKGLSSDQLTALAKLAKIPSFEQLPHKMANLPDTFGKWIKSSNPESGTPQLWSDTASPIEKKINVLLVIQALRPDRIIAATEALVMTVFSNDFMAPSKESSNLGYIVKTEIHAETPLCLIAVQGYDPSTHVEDLSKQRKIKLHNIALGSAEGFSQADKALESAGKNGNWVMLKNTHLAPTWLMMLEKKLSETKLNPSFRIFLTMEINPKLPVNILRSGRMFMFEPPPGIKANLVRTLDSVQDTRIAEPPSERARLYMLLIWIHAIVQERIRYVPLGWSKKYEFNESDLRCACDTIDTWLKISKGSKIPWDALTSLTGLCIYGGRVDNAFDQKLLEGFLRAHFNESSLSKNFNLVKDTVEINTVEAKTKEDISKWITELPNQQSPSWLGLPNNAEALLLSNRGMNLVTNLTKLSPCLEEDEDVVIDVNLDGRKSDCNDSKPEWMRVLMETTQEWLSQLPVDLKPLQRTPENIKDPMYRCFEREVNMGIDLLVLVRKELTEVHLVLSGEKKATNPTRIMMDNLAKSLIPKNWMFYKVPTSITLLQWMADFVLRLEQFDKASSAAENGGPPQLIKLKVWLGGLFMPEAYITATRQATAQAHQWALEELILVVDVGGQIQKSGKTEDGFNVDGLVMIGAAPTTKDNITIAQEVESKMAITKMTWIKKKSKPAPIAHVINLPLYLNSERTTLLFTIQFDSKVSESEFYRRGAAIVASTLG